MKAKPNWNLLTKYINHECNDVEKEEFEHWLGLSNENREYYNQIKEAWKAYGVDHVSLIPNKAKAWENISSNFNERKPVTRRILTWAVRVAASLLLLAGLVFIIKNQLSHSNNIELQSEITDSNSKTKKIILSDGTVVWLNKLTTIEYPKAFEGNERRINLYGEAFFEVRKDAKRPFIIETETTVTQVIGTSFNLRSYKFENQVKLNVNSGKVAFYPKANENDKIILTKGFAGKFDEHKNVVIKSKVTDINYQSWKTGKLFFHKTKLSDVCIKLEEQYHKKINFASDDLKSLTISATYNNQDFIEIIDLISQTLDINYQLKEDTVLLLND